MYIKVESIIAKTKGKFETPRGGAASTGTTKAKTSSDSKKKTTSSASGTSASKTVAAGKASGSSKKRTGLIAGIIAVVAICAGIGIGVAWKTGAFSSASEALLEASAEETPVEELTNLTDYTEIYPNVYIGGLDVGGMSTDEALEALQEYVADDLTKTLWVTLSSGESLTFDVVNEVQETSLQNLVTEAWNHGREGTAEEQAEALEAAEGGEAYTVELTYTTTPDTESLREQVDAYADELQQEVVQTVVSSDAVQLEDSSYAMEVTKGTSGVSFDADELYLAVVQAATTGNYDPIEFEVTTVEPDALDYETLETTWNKEAENAYYDVSTETVIEGSYGYSVDMDTVAAMLEEAEEGETFQVPMTILYPEIDKATMEASLFADTLSSKSTYYSSNANRTTNLRLACEAINGTVIQPGETFSFNDVVGERTAEKGYQAATVFANGGSSEQELGGGICQVASTIYYCALYANLEIVDRTEHMYTVDYIEGGLDATVYWGSVDFKFRNNTDYPIKIIASVTGTVNIEIVGTKTDDTYVIMEVVDNGTTAYDVVTKVDESKPVGYYEVTQTAYTGHSYTSYRCIYAADGTLISRTKEADSVHKARDRIITVGPSSSTTTEEETEETETPETTETTQPTEETPTESSGTTTETPTESTTPTETQTPETTTPATENPAGSTESGEDMITD